MTNAVIYNITKEESAKIALSIDEILMDGDRMRCLPAAELYKIDHTHLRIWACLRSRYTIVTTELIDWLKEQIGDRSALEVAAGMGDIGYHLKIKQSDSCIQTQPLIRLYYQSIGQPITDPPQDILREEAVHSIKKHKPDIVVASWLTQLHQAGDADGCMFGADEEEILRHAPVYIMIGNASVHGNKRILQQKHEKIQAEWLFSRSLQPTENAIWIWRH